MLKLITILEDLKLKPRPLTDEENLFLNQLGDELRRATNNAERWQILEREGLTRLNDFNFSEDVIAKLTEIRRAAMH
jgi:hypothetical protein